MIQFRGINVVLWFILARFRSLLSFQINQKSINALKTKVVRVQYKVLSETKRPVFCFVLFLLFPLFVSINQEIKPSHGLVYQPPHPIPTPPSFRNQLFLLDDQYLQTQKCNKQSSWNKNTLPNGSIQVTNHDSRAPQSRALHFATSGCPLGLSLVPPWSFLVSRFWKNYILLVSSSIASLSGSFMPYFKCQLSFCPLHPVDGQLTFEAIYMFNSKGQNFRSLFLIKENSVTLLKKTDKQNLMVSCNGPMLSEQKVSLNCGPAWGETPIWNGRGCSSRLGV